MAAEPLLPLLRRRALLGGSEEADFGVTYPTISAAMTATSIFDATAVPEQVYDQGKRRPMNNYLGSVQAAPGTLAGRLRFRNEIRVGDRTLPLLTGAGFVLDTGVYKPTSTLSSRKTWAFALWQDGRRKEVAAANADLTITLEVGAPAMAEWDWLGRWRVLASDAALPSNPALTALPYVCTALTMTVGGAAPPRIRRATIKLNNTVTLLKDLRATSGGIAYAMVTDRAPTLEVEMEARKKADLDTYGLLTTATEVAFSAALANGGNSLTIAAPKAQRVQVAEGENEGVLMDNLTFDLNANSGDDELTFTEA